ncbi:hypothetical protein V8C40DRAFT_242038 [Trichoderma camerunense]
MLDACATRCLRGDAPLHGQETADRLDDGCHCCCTKRPCIEGVDGVICPCKPVGNVSCPLANPS